MGLRTPVKYVSLSLRSSKKGGNTGGTHVLSSGGLRCQPRLLSRPIVQDAEWHRSTILCDVTSYHGIQFINSLCGLRW